MNLALLVPTTIGAVLVFPGCEVVEDQCQNDGECTGGRVCVQALEGQKYCDFPPTPDDQPPDEPPDVELDDPQVDGDTGIEATANAEEGDLEIGNVVIRLTSDAFFNPFPPGVVIGQLEGANEDGAFEVDVVSTDENSAYGDIDDNRVEGANEPKVEVPPDGDGEPQILIVTLPQGGNGSSLVKYFPSDSTMALDLTAPVVSTPTTPGPLRLVFDVDSVYRGSGLHFDNGQGGLGPVSFQTETFTVVTADGSNPACGDPFNPPDGAALWITFDWQTGLTFGPWALTGAPNPGNLEVIDPPATTWLKTDKCFDRYAADAAFFGRPNPAPGPPETASGCGFGCPIYSLVNDCEDDADCAVGSTCDAPTGICIPGTCTEDFECPFGSQCSSTGLCTASFCDQDADCGAGYVCAENDRCVVETCTIDADCGLNSECDEDRDVCTRLACASDAGCEGGFACEEEIGLCSVPSCFDDSDCAGEFVCNRDTSSCEAPPVETCEIQPFGQENGFLATNQQANVDRLTVVQELVAEPAGEVTTTWLESVCIVASCRAQVCDGHLYPKIFDGAGGAPGCSKGPIAPIQINALRNEDVKVCTPKLGFNLGLGGRIHIGAEWDARVADFKLAADFDGLLQPIHTRAASGSNPFGPFSPLGIPEVRSIGVGANLFEAGPLTFGAADQIVSMGTRQIEVAATEAMDGAVKVGVALTREGATDTITAFAEREDTGATDSVVVRQGPAPSFSLDIEPIPDHKDVFATAVSIDQGVARAQYLRMVQEYTGGIQIESAAKQIGAHSDNFEVSLVRTAAGLFAVTFRAGSAGRLHELYKFNPLTLNFDFFRTVDIAGNAELGAIDRAIRMALFAFGNKLCIAMPFVLTLAGNAVDTFDVDNVCVDTADPQAPIVRRELTGPLEAGDGAGETETAQTVFQQDACASDPMVSEGGVLFYNTNVNRAAGNADLNVQTFVMGDDGVPVAGGGRTVEEIEFVPGAFPDLAATAKGDGTVMLCFGGEVGAPVIKCTQWFMTGYDPDPDSWTRIGETTLIPGNSSPLDFDDPVPDFIGPGGLSESLRADGEASPRLAARVVDPASLTPELTLFDQPELVAVRQVANAFNLVSVPTRQPAPCVDNRGVTCLGEGDRFGVISRWRTPQGASGSGAAQEVTEDSGLATFFNPDNVELFFKTVDACSLPAFRSHWFFLTGLTNVGVVTTIVDSQTGAVKKYVNPLGRPFEAVLDTEAFTSCPLGAPLVTETASSGRSVGSPAVAAKSQASSSAAADVLLAEPETDRLPDWALEALAEASRAGAHTVAAADRHAAAPATLAPRAGGCRPGPNTLCLNDGRFAVEVEFDPPNGRAAEARIFGLTGDTGAFRFFNPENLELLVKVLDACASPFNSFWVFAAGLTNVEVALTVTDTQTGAVKSYTNPQGRPFVPIQDTSAFKTCP